jgi:hypothetical protein
MVFFLLINILLVLSLCYSFSINKNSHIISINRKININNHVTIINNNNNKYNNEYVTFNSNNIKRSKGISLSMVSTISKVSQNQQYLPKHPELIQGKLDNGFTYVILPNSVPVGRFEAHLER